MIVPAAHNGWRRREEHHSGRRGATVCSSVLNLANTMLGVGMLALPSAVAAAGWLGGALLTGFSILVFGISGFLLAEACATIGPGVTLSELNEIAFGATVARLFDASVVVGIGGTCTAYLIVVGDSVPGIVVALGGPEHGHPILVRRELWILMAVGAILPLFMLRRIHALRFASMVVIGCGLVISATVVAFAVIPSRLDAHEGCEFGASACKGMWALYTSPLRTLTAMPAFTFAYAANTNVPTVYSELACPSRGRMLLVLCGAVALSTALYLSLAFGGYYTFGDEVRSDLLLSYPQTLPLVLARLALCVVAVLSFPTLGYPAPYCLASLLCASTTRTAPATRAEVERRTATTTRAKVERLVAESLFVTEPTQIGMHALYLCITAAVALSVSDLGSIISMIGAVNGTVALFLWGPAAYVCLNASRGGNLAKTHRGGGVAGRVPGEVADRVPGREAGGEAGREEEAMPTWMNACCMRRNAPPPICEDGGLDDGVVAVDRGVVTHCCAMQACAVLLIGLGLSFLPPLIALTTGLVDIGE